MRLICAALLSIAAALPLQLTYAASEPSPAILRVLELTNAERSKNGLAPLALNPELAEAAQAYSEVMATSGCFAHTCGPVPDMVDRLAQAGYTGWSAIAENIAAGYRTPEAVVDGWLRSPGHRANMLSSRYTEIGIGHATGEGRFEVFWTQTFGTRPGAPAAQAQEVAPEPELVVEPETEAPSEEGAGDYLSQEGEPTPAGTTYAPVQGRR